MLCRECQSKGKCIDSRGASTHVDGTRRRYECLECGERWSSYEFRVDKVDGVKMVQDRMAVQYGTMFKQVVIERLEGLVQELREGDDECLRADGGNQDAAGRD